MILNFFRRLLSVPYNYANPRQWWLATGLLRFLLVGLGVWALVTGFVIIPPALDERTVDLPRIMMLVVAPGTFLAAIRLVRNGRLLASSLLTVVILMTFSIVSISNRGIDSAALLAIATPLVAGGLFLNRRWLTLVVVFVAVSIALFTLADYRTLDRLWDIEFASAFGGLAIILALLYIFNGSPEQLVQQNATAIERLRIVGRFPVQVFHTDEVGVYADMLSLVRGELDYDFAQIFLADENEALTRNLRLAAGFEQGYVVTEVQVRETSALAEATRMRLPVLVSANDSSVRRGHFLFSTFFGVAVPVLAEGRLLAVLDVQNANTPFSETDIMVLLTLAEAVTAMVAKVGIISGLREQIAEQHAAADNLRKQLHYLKHTEREVVGTDWETYLDRHKVEAVGFDAEGGSRVITPAFDLPEDLRQAIADGSIHIEKRDGEQVVTVPIRLRNEVLGAIAFSVPAEAPLTTRKMDAAQSIAGRLATALENKLLFEQSRLQATRERTAGEIAGLLISATDVDSVLSLAANSFNEALGAVSTRIHLQPDIFAEKSASPEQGD